MDEHREHVRIRKTKYEELKEYSRETGISIEELVDRALTEFVEHEQFIARMRSQIHKAGT